MRVLLSVYACDPTKGSEPGIGWNWVISLNRLGYDLTVVTRLKNKSLIDKATAANPTLTKVKFLYYDPPIFWIKIKPYLGVYLYYELWQSGLPKFLENNVSLESIDIVHHLTFGVFRQPTRLYKLKKPLIIGPLGGGEFAPKSLLRKLPLKYRFLEWQRDAFNYISFFRSSLNSSFEKAAVIFSRTIETYDLIPEKYHWKTYIKVDIGSPKLIGAAFVKKELNINKKIKILYAGRLVYWKGLSLAINAFASFHTDHPDSELTIVGSGDYEIEMKRLVKKLGLHEHILFKGAVSHQAVNYEYLKADIFLFPSLHDAGPNVIFEAANYGLPIVALNIGGVGQLLSSNYPAIISSSDFDYEDTIKQLANMLLKLATDPLFYQATSDASITISKINTWDTNVSNVYQIIEDKLNQN